MLAAFLLAVCLLAAARADETSEYDVKAAFLFHFAQFVEWPAETFKDANMPFVYCTVGDDPFLGALDAIVNGKAIANRSLAVRHLKAREQFDGCQILFISAAEKKHQSEYLARASGHPILIVGETEDFAAQGGMIGFCVEKNKVRFEINVETAERARLKISSRLLLLAKTIIGGRKQ